MDEVTYQKTMTRALKLLAAKPRSKVELRDRLSEKAAEIVVTRVISRLEELGYLNDEKFAASYAAARIATRPLGRMRLRRDLQRRKVANEVAEQGINLAFEETGEEILIDRAIATRLRLRGRPTTRQEVQKLFAHLVRLGFGFDLVLRRVRALSTSEDITEDS